MHNKIKKILQNLHPLKKQNKQSKLLKILDRFEKQRIIGHQTYKLMIDALKLDQTRVRDIMISSSETIYINEDDSYDEVIEVLSNNRFSRYPILNDNLRTTGILLAKDFLIKEIQNEIDIEQFSIKNYALDILVTTESKKIGLLMKEMQAKKQHLFAVIDEFGEFSGIVTMEDIIEELVGEIEDEQDNNDYVKIIKNKDDSYSMQGLTKLEEFNKFFSVDLDEEVDTINGLMLLKLGYLPKVGEFINMADFKFIAYKVNKRIIEEVLVLKNNT